MFKALGRIFGRPAGGGGQDDQPHARTIATLDALDAVEWFHACGTGDLDGVRPIASWEEAMVHAASLEWENLRLEAANDFTVRLLEANRQAYASWNDRVQVVKPYVQALVDDKLRAFAPPQHVEALRVEANWDLLHLCMECEFADHVEPGFYAALAFYYRAGHFPCGIEGDPATGPMIVY